MACALQTRIDMNRIADALEHSTWQERELFETAAETMSAHQLADLGSRLHEYVGTSFAIAACST